MAKRKETQYLDSGSIFIGCMLVGIGIGLLFDLMPGALFIGMGTGLLLPVLLRMWKK